MKSTQFIFFAVMVASFITVDKSVQAQALSPQGFSLQNNSRQFADEEIKDPVLLFETILKDAVQTDKDAQRSLAAIYKKIPEQSTHQKNVKRVLGDRFKEKFNVKIEEVVLVPEPQKEVEPPKPVSYGPAVWGTAAAVLVPIAAFFGHYAMQQGGADGRQAEAAAAQRQLQRMAWGVRR
jgi:hypothetical protein